MNIFQIIAFIILFLFYAIYIGKMVIQKKKGIQTDQMARGKKARPLFVIEMVMKTATYSLVAVELWSIYQNKAIEIPGLRIFGGIVGVVGLIVFGIAVYTMRDSWRAGIPEKDKTQLVTNGIYKISRNPAFLGFDLVYIGIVLMFFNAILLLFTIWSMTMFHLQILQEEKFLTSAFGKPYEDYKVHTRRYL